MEILKQPQYEPVPVERQVVVIYAVNNGYLDEFPVERVGQWEREFLGFLTDQRADLLDEIRSGMVLTEDLETELKGALDDFNARFRSELEESVSAA